MSEQENSLDFWENAVSWTGCPPDLLSMPGSIKPKEEPLIDPLHLGRTACNYLCEHTEIEDNAGNHDQEIAARSCEGGAEFLLGKELWRLGGTITLFTPTNKCTSMKSPIASNPPSE